MILPADGRGCVQVRGKNVPSIAIQSRVVSIVEAMPLHLSETARMIRLLLIPGDRPPLGCDAYLSPPSKLRVPSQVRILQLRPLAPVQPGRSAGSEIPIDLSSAPHHSICARMLSFPVQRLRSLSAGLRPVTKDLKQPGNVIQCMLQFSNLKTMAIGDPS